MEYITWVDIFVLVVVFSLCITVVVYWVIGFFKLVNAMLMTIQEEWNGDDYRE